MDDSSDYQHRPGDSYHRRSFGYPSMEWLLPGEQSGACKATSDMRQAIQTDGNRQPHYKGHVEKNRKAHKGN
jgi:hypothetical protein